MGNSLLADTSILIDIQKNVPKTITEFSQHQDNIIISRITINEFIYGSRDKREKKINQEFLNQLPIIEIDSDISLLSYHLIDTYALKLKLGLADAFIAATAITHNLTLWTLNTKHFLSIKEIKLHRFKT